MSEYRYIKYGEMFPERDEYDGGDFLDSEYCFEALSGIKKEHYPIDIDMYAWVYIYYINIAIHEAYADDYIAFSDSTTPDPSLTRQLNAWFYDNYLAIFVFQSETIRNYIKQYGEKPVQQSIEKVTRSMNKNLKDTGTSSNTRTYETNNSGEQTTNYGKSATASSKKNYTDSSEKRSNILPQQDNPTSFTGFDYMNSYEADSDKSLSDSTDTSATGGKDTTSASGTGKTSGREDFTRDYLKTDDTTESKEKVNENQVESIPEVVDNLVRLLERVCHNCIAEFGRTWIKYPPRKDIIEAIRYD